MSHVGIFWFVPSNMPGTSTLVADMTPIGEAPDYAGFKTHDRGHSDHWASLARLGARALRAEGLPRIIASTAYNTYPRGRVVYDPTQQRYTIHADAQLQQPEFVAEIVFYFGIPEGCFTVQADPDYASSVPVPPPKDIW